MVQSILVVGAGATGGYLGARLAQAGRDVTFLVHDERVDALREFGLNIITPDGPQKVSPRVITAAEISSHYDVIVVAVPATAVESAIDDIEAAVGRHTVIIPFLNGIRHLALLNERFGEAAVLGGVVKIATDATARGETVLLARGSSLVLGDQRRGVTTRCMEIVAELNVDGVTVRAIEDIVGAMWHEWAFIASLNATTILAGAPVGDVVAAEGGATLGALILSEAAAISASANHPLTSNELQGFRGILAQSGSGMTSSLYRAVAAGRPTDAEPILGDFIRCARAAGVLSPLLDVATLRLRVYENKRKKQES